MVSVRGAKTPKLYSGRYFLLLLLLTLAMAGLVWRMVDLAVIDRDFLLRQGDARTLRIINTPAYRGMITDRHGEPLAISTPVESVWINPQDFDSHQASLPSFAALIHMPVKDIQKRLSHVAGREFVYLKRGLGPVVAAKIRAFDIPGVYLQREFRRFYPEAEVTAQLLGYTNIDDKGQEGIELAYDKWLQGRAGKKRVLKDRLGHIVADVESIQEPSAGHNLVLSIDRRIQYLAYRVLKAAFDKHQAKSATAIVLDISTGEVLAMVNQPSYNPNERNKAHDARFRNRAVTDLYEPGSVMKPFTIVSALANGQYQPNTLVDTSPGWIVLAYKTFNDERNYGAISVSRILQRSSNVGMIKIILSLAPDALWQTLHAAGFGQRTNSGFPGESAGVLVNRKRWRPIALATMAFGYGLSVTPLQLAHAYTMLGHDGRLLPISLLRLNKAPSGKQAISPKIAHQLHAMLTKVVDNGTGKRAQVKAYQVAGKTGTARIAGANGYQVDHHIATFVGMAPSHPRLVVAVLINDPSKKGYYGGQIAAPVFAEIMAGSLRMLDISPDRRIKAKG